MRQSSHFNVRRDNSKEDSLESILELSLERVAVFLKPDFGEEVE